MPNNSPTITLIDSERAALADLRLRAHGIFKAAALVGVSRDTYERAAGGLPIRRGSAALIRTSLANLGASDLGTMDGHAHPIESR